MSTEYSENKLIQGSVDEILQKLDWKVIYAHNQENLGENGTLGRAKYSDVVLRRYFKKALFKFNDWMTDIYFDMAYEKLCSVASFSTTLIGINEEKYKMLRDGISIEYTKKDESKEYKNVKIFDFNHPEENHFLAVKELKIDGMYSYEKRPDIVGFVNGVPLLFMELKNYNKNIRNAYEDNYKDYIDTIPQLFYFNAFIIFSNGLESKVGTLESKYEFFHEWKRLQEDEEGKIDLDTMLRGICNKKNFMDLFENFLVFDHTNGKTAKILARNHQYLGVNEAITSYENRKLNNGKLGIFWHTQGSGKSYSMVFLAQKIRRKFEGSPTFIVLTDRDDLDKQINTTFEECKCLDSKTSKYTASSGVDLISMLNGNPSFVFTTIQMFNNRNPIPIYPKHDVIILSDEAHRSQNGVLADNMLKLLPTASRIGFTGTPIFDYDNITERTFGGYVSIYDFTRAIEDGATVPLYYENRSNRLNITNPNINEELLNAIEQADLDVIEQSKLEQEISKEIHIITAQPRLDAIAKDFVEHYSELWTSGKAMFICVNKVTCVKMYDLAQKYWKLKIDKLESELKNLSQQEYQEMERKIVWMKETEMAVVISQEQNEIQTFKNWDLDIIPHREKMKKRELDKEFKDSDNPFRIVFVCAMWMTGFDVKSLGNLYIDKPLKDHTLMQAIARANRVCEGKSNGLIIDYIGIVKALREALASYTGNKKCTKGETPLKDKSELIEKIEKIIDDIKNYMQKYNFYLDELIATKDKLETLSLIANGANAMCETDEIKKSFEIQSRELFRNFKYIEYNEVSLEIHKYKDAISAIYNRLQKNIQHIDNSALMQQINEIVSRSILIDKTISNDKSFDISKIDFERLRVEFENQKNKNLVIKDMQTLIDERMKYMINKNPTRIDYYEKYQQIIDEYNQENSKDKIIITWEKLLRIVSELDEEDKRYVRQGFNNDDELAIFDLLDNRSLAKEEIKKIKKIAQELFAKVQVRINELDRWREKEKTRSEIKILVHDTLWENLPDSYNEEMIKTCSQKIFNHIYNTIDGVA